MTEQQRLNSPLLNLKTKNIDGYVYFFESSLTKLIKIGFTKNVSKRKKQIEAMQGGPVNVLKTLFTYHRNEKYLHEKFSHLKTHGEWFAPDPELLTFIKELTELNY